MQLKLYLAAFLFGAILTNEANSKEFRTLLDDGWSWISLPKIVTEFGIATGALKIDVNDIKRIIFTIKQMAHAFRGRNENKYIVDILTSRIEQLEKEEAEFEMLVEDVSKTQRSVKHPITKRSSDTFQIVPYTKTYAIHHHVQKRFIAAAARTTARSLCSQSTKMFCHFLECVDVVAYEASHKFIGA